MTKQRNVATIFGKVEYKKVLQFCVDNNLTKYDLAQKAILKYCSIPEPRKKERGVEAIRQELEVLKNET